MKNFASCLLVSLLFSTAAFTTECIGPASATRFVVYLHGMDTNKPSEQEQKNRTALSAAAEKLNIRFALPRAVTDCPTNPKLKCWTWTEQDSIDPVLGQISQAANDCFSGNDFSLLGFSNGGYVMNKIMRKCVQGKYSKLYSFGAGGEWAASDVQDLATCPLSLSVNVGRGDHYNVVPARDFHDHIKSLGGNVSYSTYSGGHRLTAEALIQALSK